jgi:FkbH-like protein
MQVPKDIYKYPLEFRKLTNVFTRLNSSKEDKLKTQMYKDELKRNDTKNTYKNINEYITSLNLKMSISINDLEIIERISQMTQKTNQFNATTIRLTKNEVNDFIKSINNFVLSFTLSDKFGKFGVSGCAFIEVIGEDAFVRNILLSCRVLGRTSEDVFVKEIFIFLKKLNIKTCYFDYIKSPKNSQVRSFFNKMSFKLVKDNAKSDLYSLNLEKYIIINTKTIKVDYEKSN